MDVSIFARNLEMTPRLSEYVDRKVEKLDRYLPSIEEARIDLTVENTRSAAHSQVAQLTVRVRGTILRAEERTQDMFASIDAVLDKMYRQIARYKGKRRDRLQAAAEPLPVEFDEATDETVGEIVRVKRFDVRPMLPEEARIELDVMRKDFIMFKNSDTGEANVIYKRSDGTYGLIEPKF